MSQLSLEDELRDLQDDGMSDADSVGPDQQEKAAISASIMQQQDWNTFDFDKLLSPLASHKADESFIKNLKKFVTKPENEKDRLLYNFAYGFTKNHLTSCAYKDNRKRKNKNEEVILERKLKRVDDKLTKARKEFEALQKAKAAYQQSHEKREKVISRARED